MTLRNQDRRSRSVSELRQDIVSGEWVVIATGRAKRPQEFIGRKRASFNQPKKTCPFESLSSDALLALSLDGKERNDNWWLQVVPNKYPAFGKGKCSVAGKIGPYAWSLGVGFHEVVVTRDHARAIGSMNDDEVELIMRAYQERYHAMKKSLCVEYVSIFHNHGRLSGASISHPHSQIIAIPVIPPDVARSLEGSAAYFRAHHTCVHCMVVRHELKQQVRIVYENEQFAVITPYASKTAFEMRIFPKFHSAYFEDTNAGNRMLLANALRTGLGKISRGLGNPDLNFFLHTAPASDGEKFGHYHWHIEILPKTAIWAGFEISTGIDITTITPESAAQFLKTINV